jgi:hypothetical protein
LFTLLTYEIENTGMNFPFVRSDGVLSDINSFAGHRFFLQCSIWDRYSVADTKGKIASNAYCVAGTIILPFLRAYALIL